MQKVAPLQTHTPIEADAETYAVRRAREEDLNCLPAIERRAGQLFADAGLENVANNEPVSQEYLLSFLNGGAVHVAVDHADKPVGFALTGLLDGACHLYELSVDPDHGRRGLGARLVTAGCVYAQDMGCRAMTLSTFLDLPWNGPFYKKLGFNDMARAAWTPGLHLLYLREIDIELPVIRRGFMRKDF